MTEFHKKMEELEIGLKRFTDKFSEYHKILSDLDGLDIPNDGIGDEWPELKKISVRARNAIKSNVTGDLRLHGKEKHD